MISLIPPIGELPVRIHPKLGESLRGYFLRVSENYGLHSPSILLKRITGKPMGIPTIHHLELISDYLGIPQHLLLDMSGFLTQYIDGEKQVKIGTQWITSQRFILNTNQQVCPLCLRSNPYIRGEWLLTYYSACHIHKIQLVEKCPACGRHIFWYRSNLCLCQCGHRLVDSPAIICSDEELSISQEITYKAFGGTAPPFSLPIPSSIMSVLQNSTLDSFLGLIWFFGYCDTLSDGIKPMHGRKKHTGAEARNHILRSINFLSGWPDRLSTLLSGEQHVPIRNFILKRRSDPHHYFLLNHLVRTQKDYWLNNPNKKRTRSTFPQLELNL